MEKLFYAEEDNMETAKTLGLTNTERALFANQFRILKGLNKDDDHLVQHYERLETIVERGYKQMYDHVLGELWNELPDEVSNEVFEILDMHFAMLNSLGTNPSPVDLEKVKFKGFDANNESKHLMFAKFYTNDGEYYPDLRIFNSHMPTLERYRKMLVEWRRMGQKPNLSKAQIESILEAGTFHH